VYLGALVSVIVRINDSMERRRLVAEQEFYAIADLASSSGALSFMDETFIEIIQGNLNESITLEGVIISGPSGEYGFEKERGKALAWVNNSPRFRSRFDFSRQPLYLPLRIQGLRNVNIQAVAGAFDFEELSKVLRQALFLVASALALAFLTLFLESLRNKKRAVPGEKTTGYSRPPSAGAAKEGPKAQPDAAGGYSERGRVVREENAEKRLADELQRCAEAGNDLSIIAMEFKIDLDDASYARFAADAARFFSSRNFVCERGGRGVWVICPGLNLDAGFLNAGEFHTRVMGKYPGLFKSNTDLCIGLSAGSGRPAGAQRLMFEAEEALERALMDPVSHIVAFKSDPEKYKAFMESQGTQHGS
jgi:hypothetical protein